MKKTATTCCVAAIGFWLSTSTARAQTGVNFSNWGQGWAEPWYGGPSSNSLQLFSPDLCNGVWGVPVSPGPLAGTAFTAELWGGLQGSAEFNLQFLARTTFRTGAAAGLLLPINSVPVPFAQPGQRVALQMRVYDNRAGTVTSWAQASFDYTIVTGTSKLFTSQPLGDTPVSLQGMGSFCVTTDFIRLPVPIMTLATGGTIDIWGGPAPLKFWPSTSGRSLVAGDTVTLKVEVPHPAKTITWSHNDIELPGQTNQSLVLSNIQPNQSGFYTARITASIGSLVFSGAATSITSLEVTPRPRLEDAARDISGTFTAQIRGVINRSVAIESSTDLRNWVRGPPRWMNGSFCTGNTVTNPPLFGPQLFYRAVVLP